MWASASKRTLMTESGQHREGTGGSDLENDDREGPAEGRLTLHFPVSFALKLAFTWSLWVVRRPFLLSRRRWIVVFMLGATVEAVAWFFLPVQIALALLLLPLVAAAVLIHWWWLGRGDQPIVFVSRFKGQSRVGREAAETHLGALVSFLRSDANLETIGPLQIREIPISLSREQAERLMRISGSLLVVRGSGDAVADQSRWEWWLHFSQQIPDLKMTEYELSVRDNVPKRTLASRLRSIPPTVAETHDVEGGLNMQSFVSEPIVITHFRAIGKALCVLASQDSFEKRDADHPARIMVPEPRDPELPESLQGRAAIMEAGANIGSGQDQLGVLKDLQDLVLSGHGDATFGTWVEAQWFAASIEQRVSNKEAFEANTEIAARFPEDSHVVLNAAASAVKAMELERAEELLEQAEKIDPTDRGISRIRGNIAWERRNPASALSFYRLASTKEGPQQIWQMADCHLALDEPAIALKLYRKQLRRDSTTTIATRHARAVRGIPSLLPTMPTGWRLSLWYRLHLHPRLAQIPLRLWRFCRPEEPFLTTWLARQALIVGDLSIAKRWIQITTAIGETNMMLSIADGLIVASLLGEGNVDENIKSFKTHVTWLKSKGIQQTNEDLETSLRLLRTARPDLFEDEPIATHLRQICKEFELDLFDWEASQTNLIGPPHAS